MTQAEPRQARLALPTRLAAALVFLSSGAVLVLEVVGLRLVAPYVGITLETNSAVIGVALGAIALGAWSGGRLADIVDPRQLLAPAFLIAALATVVTLPIVRYAGELLRGEAAAAAVLLLATMAVFVPAALLAAITPLVVKLQLADLRRTGSVVGRLSGIGTLGGIAATFGTGFVLVAALPSSVIVLGLAVLLSAAGVALAVYLRREAVAHGKRRTTVALALVGLGSAGLTAVAPSPCDVETAYHCADVRADPERAGGRLLVLNSGWHSYVDIHDPAYLKFEYTQTVASLVDVMAPPRSPVAALHLGGGGLTLPRYVSATRPDSRNRVLELDGRVLALDQQAFGARPGPGLELWAGDARIGLARAPADSRDLVVGDAFGHLAPPWHLTTREAVTEVRRVLRPGGLYAANLIDSPPHRFVMAEVATIAAVFRHVAVIAPAHAIAKRDGANFVVVASDAPLPLPSLRERLRQRRTPVVMIDGAAVTRFAGGARVLTDDYAPVDQLFTP